MASKQAAAPIKNAERARNTEATFGKDSQSDPWRAHPGLAGFQACLKPDYTKPYGDKSRAYTDRFGTGVARDAEYVKPAPADAKQPDNAAQKGATAKTYRPPVTGVVQ